MKAQLPIDLNSYLPNYQNTKEVNDLIFQQFTSGTNTIPYLKEHRDFVETKKLGFGDRAFHFMWLLLTKDLCARFNSIDALEIGVFKGQVISLWGLISKIEKLKININGISPLQGNPSFGNRLLDILFSYISPKYRADVKSGNHYKNENYVDVINTLFKKFDLDFKKVSIHKGYSTDSTILTELQEKRYHLIYVDGDHSFNGVLADLDNYANKIHLGGYLVMDDASCNIPGTVFWKGHQSVSDAVEKIDSTKFQNVLNVGHNRIYKRIV